MSQRSAMPPFVNEYNGYSLASDTGTPSIDRIALEDLTPESFYCDYVAKRKPCVIVGTLSDPGWLIPQQWTVPSYLKSKAGNVTISVEKRSSTTEKFGKGNEVKLSFGEFLDLLEDKDPETSSLYYLTTQDVTTDKKGRPQLLSPLMQVLSDDFPLKPTLMGNLIPQNINLWMGNSPEGSSSGLHHDYHDNLYILIEGKKHFDLYAPSDAMHLYTRGKLQHIHPNGRINYVGEGTQADGSHAQSEAALDASLAKDAAAVKLQLAEEAVANGEPGAEESQKEAEDELEQALEAILDAEHDSEDADIMEEEEGAVDDANATDTIFYDGEGQSVEKTVKDPLNFSLVHTTLHRAALDAQFPSFSKARKASVEVQVGEMLYLPASWFHEVTSHGRNTAFNYWFHPPDGTSFDQPYTSRFWEKDWSLREFSPPTDKPALQKYPSGTKVEKHFPGYGWFQGSIVSFEEGYYMIEYEDGDSEEMDESEVEQHLFLEETHRKKKVAKQTRTGAAPSTGWKRNAILWRANGIDPDTFKFSVADYSEKVSERLADFFLMIYERQRIWERRSQKNPPPWSEVPVFQNYSFCNVYRELDQGTRFFHAHVLALWDTQTNPVTEHSWTCTVLWAAYVYRLMNRVDTFEKVGFPSLNKVGDFLSKCKKLIKTGAIFTRAHQTCGWDRYQHGLKQVAAKNGKVVTNVVDGLLKASTVEACLAALQRLPNVGKFMSWQLWCDLRESRCLQKISEDQDSFCLLGPGAIKGLDLIFAGSHGMENYLQLAQQVVQCQEAVFHGLGLSFPMWNGRKLGIKEIEHALCEYQKAASSNLFKCAKRTDDVVRNDGGHRCDSCLALAYSAGATKKYTSSLPLLKSPSWICGTCQKFEQVSF